ncbi:hypothetical protein F889_01172 [Acinetobacter colistiniresistens]|uniref:Porin n=1 Tax=Acinetobacter colistiniresistens TaxID=280145 RepID=N9PPW7_9GAMM|nr:TorF family putative porin [Acinetobacter colistiniresistens]ENX35503.1 hypothetical protein F889_01172 [Acinetobacter colistiniresistens]
MIKKTVMLAIFTPVTFLAIDVQAAEQKVFKYQFAVSGSMAFLTEYYWRGITQTQGKPAVQGTLRVDHDSGLYAQLFASNIQLDIGSSIEFDYYLGYDYQFNDHLKLNVQYLDVNYPGADKTLPQVDFEEYSIGLFASGLLNQQDQLNLSFYYSPDYTFETGKMLRYEVGYRYPVVDKWHAYAQAAYNQFASNQAYELLWATDEKKDFYDYKVGVDFNYQDFIFDLYYADGNVNKALKNADSTVVFSLTRTF